MKNQRMKLQTSNKIELVNTSQIFTIYRKGALNLFIRLTGAGLDHPSMILNINAIVAFRERPDGFTAVAYILNEQTLQAIVRETLDEVMDIIHEMEEKYYD